MDPKTEQFSSFNQEVAGSFPGWCPVPLLEVPLIKPKAKLGSESGARRRVLLGPGVISRWVSQLWAPQDAQLAQLAKWEDGAWAACSPIPEAC